MLSRSLLRLAAASSVAVLCTLAPGAMNRSISRAQTPPAPPPAPAPSANVSVYATGLNGPRGLDFGPDGSLYVAEAGLGGRTSTIGRATSAVGPCAQVGEVGPYTGGYTSRISKIGPNGARTTVVDGLPSAMTAPASGGDVVGASAVAFVNNVLYGMESGAGCSHGNPDVPNGVIQVSYFGTWSIYDMSTWLHTHPVAKPDAGDFEPDGDWYSMVSAGGKLYSVNSNEGSLDVLDPATAQISRVADISASQGHSVPTSLAYYNGNFYVGNLGTFPIAPGSEKVLKIAPDGTISTYAIGLTTVLGLAFDSSGNLYALESMTAPGFPGPSQFGSGKVVKITATGNQSTVATGLSFPSGMTMGPDGNLYVSNLGFGGPAGSGQIVKVNLTGK
jgi:hypothetical protein